MFAQEEMNNIKQQYHPLIFVAFLLAVFVLIAPLQADIVFAALRLKRTIQAVLIVLVSLAFVVAPLIAAQLQIRRHPDRWKSRFLTKLTWAIVILNFVFNCLIFANFIQKEYGVNQSSETSDAAAPQVQP